MKTSVRLRVSCASLLLIACLFPLCSFGRGGGGGGGGGGRGGGGGGGGGRSSVGGGGGGTRPSFGGGGAGGGGNRPSNGGGAGGGGNRPSNGGGAARPNQPSRPGISNPGNGSRPGGGGAGEKPNQGPSNGNKWNGNNGNQTGLWNKPGNNNRTGGIGNNSGNNVNINNRGRNDFNNRMGMGYGYNNGRYGYNHGNWYHGNYPYNRWYNRPAAWWGAGFIGGAVLSSYMPYSWGYSTYSNPYYVESYPVGSTTINYSQPIVSTAPTDPPMDSSANSDPSIPTTSTAEDKASQMLTEARTAFYEEDYATALKKLDQAIQATPGDTVLHEFRGLILFATKKYDQAAPTIYAVLSAGPNWDWTTLISMYANVDIYTQQLRALEGYRRANPTSAQARFLLAYHYLTDGHDDAAREEFQEVVKLQPADQLSAQMVKMLTTPTEGESEPAPESSAVATTPVEASKLVGSWQATQPDGSLVTLTVTADNKFSWKFTQNKKPQEFTGTSTLADNLLILRPADGPPLVGQVAMLADNKLNFRLDANNPGDSGLTFVR